MCSRYDLGVNGKRSPTQDDVKITRKTLTKKCAADLTKSSEIAEIIHKSKHIHAIDTTDCLYTD